MSDFTAGTSLVGGVAAHLRGAIHRGELGPGDRFPAERDLADQLGVARASLREAIKALQNDGYVEVRRGPHGGTFVTTLDRPMSLWRKRMRDEIGAIDNLLDYRIAVEQGAATLAATRRDAADMAAMRAAIAALLESKDRSAYRLADLQFHEAVAVASRSSRLESAVRATRGELFSPVDMLEYVETAAEDGRQHQEIYDAIASGNATEAGLLMRTHIDRTRSLLHEILVADLE
ncbi:FCD domain-containing protein [Rhodococcus sp. IEGM 1381]|uniref:FadR/GntR family transcriptional regulator n=1 Tax=Rhodococcus sp. IEGM 1381 TaxID=3047085 RepID=UPI0024B64D6B|nr:FCD domain-containing protein [Rhodococcus sp. IEGM 1381]MDI9894523.1 FCD domain-containing protein [Rhodococcus sp. IEGM 1381]